MSITTRSEYGLRAMVLLAEQLDDELLSTTEIARREDIPRKYLEQILAGLKKAEMVRAWAGARGGYRLARPATAITVGEIVRAVDGPLSATACAGANDSGSHRLRPLWHRLQRAMSDVLDQTTLDQLTFSPRLVAPPSQTDDRPDPDAASGSMYHI